MPVGDGIFAPLGWKLVSPASHVGPVDAPGTREYLRRVVLEVVGILGFGPIGYRQGTLQFQPDLCEGTGEVLLEVLEANDEVEIVV